ncbi:glycosyltransferase [Streptomyces sp. NPDC018045]|uniref:glycosyltransferase n=1 Tax=Streptomyces sp. NPDC018045 TaxID=3365037 RepID=UPI0037BAB1A2
MDSGPVISLIAPRFNEAGNVEALLDAVSGAIPLAMGIEVLFVDDPTDGTAEIVEKVAPRYAKTVSVHHRAEPVGGLGGAVVEGIAQTGALWVMVMDADLEHPAALIPELMAAGERAAAEMVVASRYAAGGSRRGLAGGYRVVVSGGSTTLAKGLFPRLPRRVSDPMSGFFG